METSIKNTSVSYQEMVTRVPADMLNHEAMLEEWARQTVVNYLRTVRK